MEGWPVGVWNPDAVGRVRGYPKTPEAFAAHLARLLAFSEAARAKGVLNRRGIPHGWAGRRDEVQAIREAAMADGTRVVRKLCGVERDNGADDTDPRAIMALEHAVAGALARCDAASTRIMWARLALKYLIPMAGRAPQVKADGGALAFLARLAREAREERAAAEAGLADRDGAEQGEYPATSNEVSVGSQHEREKRS
jgi:hypothetical protein